jgi:DNA-binding MarR family transcriptional regulator
VTVGDGSSPLRNDWAAGGIPPPAGAIPRVSPVPDMKSPGEAPLDPRSERIRLALRVVLHLSWTGPLQPGDVAREASTQQGMASSLQVTQGAISKVLLRLVAARMVAHERHHVRGQNRRMQAYSLTPRGADLARRYRERFPAAGPSVDWSRIWGRFDSTLSTDELLRRARTERD